MTTTPLGPPPVLQTRTDAVSGPRRRRSSTPGPVARFTPGDVASQRRRNPVWLVAGVALVAVCTLLGVVLVSSGRRQRDVVVAAHDISAGAALRATDVRAVRMAIADGVAVLTTADAAGLVEQHAIGRVPAGTLLNAAMFSPTPPVGADEMVFGAALHPGAAPTSTVTVGSTVELLTAAKKDPAAGAVAGAPAAVSLGSGVVYAVEALASGDVWVSVRVPRAVGLLASQADQDKTLRVVLAGVAVGN